jgi:glycosyltransferase involved in cell wall biosynthesis
MSNEKTNVSYASFPRRIVWISDSDLSNTLHASTWLETTRHLRQMGWEVCLVASSDHEEGPANLNGVDVLFFKRPSLFFVKQLHYHFKVFQWFSKRFKDGGILLFHEISGIWSRLFQLWVKLFGNKRVKFVIDTRTLPMEPEDDLPLRTRLRRWYLQFIYRHADRWFDGHTAITRAMADSLRIPDKQLWAVWQSGVSLELFADCHEKRGFPVGDEPIRMIYIGCMHVERNLLTFSQAIVQANLGSKKFHLILVGDGNQYDELEQFADDHPDCIEIHPPVPQTEIPGWLANAHIGVLPFPDEEKFRVSSPIKLFEYMASGLPIFATRIRCHTDIIQGLPLVFWAEGSTVNDFVVGLRQIEKEKDNLPVMGVAALSAARRFSWEASARELSEGLHSHLRSAGSGQ